jgi:hypothetical protein
MFAVCLTADIGVCMGFFWQIYRCLRAIALPLEAGGRHPATVAC